MTRAPLPEWQPMDTMPDDCWRPVALSSGRVVNAFRCSECADMHFIEEESVDPVVDGRPVAWMPTCKEDMRALAQETAH